MIVISPNLVSNLDGDAIERLHHAHIGYRNIATSVTATSAEPGFPAHAVLNPLTYERWTPEVGGGALTIDLGGLREIDYIGIAAHTLQYKNLKVEIHDGITWVELHNAAVTSDHAIMVILDHEFAQQVRLTIDVQAEIGVVYVGQLLVMPMCMYGGHSPGTLSRNTTIMPNRTENGAFLGRSVIRGGYETSYRWRHLSAQWYRGNFDPFVEAAIVKPFFIAWYPYKFPAEVLYVWCNSDIHPTNMGVRDLMEVSFNVEAIG